MSEYNDNKNSKELIQVIKEKYNRLSKGQKLIAQYIFNHYDKVAFMTASKLGVMVGVSESTVVRFANTLGYSGYPKLQEALQELVKNKLTTVQRVEMLNDYNNDGTTLEKVLKADIDNIRDTIDDIDINAFNEFCEALSKATRIYIVGMRSSYVVARYLGFYLNLILDNVQVIRLDMGEPFEQMIRVGEGDVVLAISFPRYSKKSSQTLQFAKERGATVLSLTDSHFAPVSSLSDTTLLIKSAMASFVDSLVPALSVANAIIVTVGKNEKEDITNYLEDLEEVWDKYDVYE